MEKFYNQIKKKGRSSFHRVHGYALSDSVVRGTHMVLHQALDMAVKERLIARNPTNGTTIPKVGHVEKQVLCDSQLDKFIEIIKQEPYWYDFFYVEIMTGLRRGEICGLQWPDINFTDKTLFVRRSISKQHGCILIGETKTDTGRRKILLPQSVVALLQERRKEAVGEWVFPHFAKPTEPLNPNSAYTKLKSILKRANLPSIRFHDLRHTFATHAIQGGVDAKTLAGILGHTDASFTLDTYTHVTNDMQKSASTVVNNMMQKFLM